MKKIFAMLAVIMVAAFSVIPRSSQPIASAELKALAVAPPAPLPSPQTMDVTGEIDRQSGKIKFDSGILAGRKFGDLTEASASLEKEGFSKEGVDRIETVLSNTYQGGEDVETVKPSASDSVIRIEERGVKAKFEIAADSLAGFNTVAEYLEKKEGQQGCVKISKSCMKCPDKRIYCLIVNLKTEAGTGNVP